MENFKSTIPPFYPNQKAVCKWNRGWRDSATGSMADGPSENDTVTVLSCKMGNNAGYDTWYLQLKEWPDPYGWAYHHPKFGALFEPIDKITATRMKFNEIEKTEELKEAKEQELIFQN